MSKNILISGGTGFVGGSIINRLKENYHFINVGRNSNKYCDNLYWDLKLPIVEARECNIDIIIHSASIVGSSGQTKEYIDVNVKSTLELLEFGKKKGIKKFIYISTGGVYGYGDKKFVETDECNPGDLYSMTKYFSEKLCKLYKDDFNIIILRLFFPYGNKQRRRLISNLVENIINEKEIVLNESGLPTINPIHITDVINIIKMIIDMDCEGIYNISGDQNISIKDLCELISDITNTKNVKYMYNGNNVKKMMGDNSKINELCNYKCRVNLEDGIRSLIHI